MVLHDEPRRPLRAVRGAAAAARVRRPAQLEPAGRGRVGALQGAVPRRLRQHAGQQPLRAALQHLLVRLRPRRLRRRPRGELQPFTMRHPLSMLHPLTMLHTSPCYTPHRATHLTVPHPSPGGCRAGWLHAAALGVGVHADGELHTPHTPLQYICRTPQLHPSATPLSCNPLPVFTLQGAGIGLGVLLGLLILRMVLAKKKSQERK